MWYTMTFILCDVFIRLMIMESISSLACMGANGILWSSIVMIMVNAILSIVYWVAWWPSGLVTRHSALRSRVRIPVAVGEIYNQN